MSEETKLQQVVERVRSERFSNLDPSLPQEIVKIQVAHPDDDAEAYKRSHEALRRYARRQSSDVGGVDEERDR